MQQPASSSPPYLWIETAHNAITVCLPRTKKKKPFKMFSEKYSQCYSPNRDHRMKERDKR